jgi:D-beta-D-heptose 7-phosphate kinase/D-beta-D-heptose 1-phosphate adenosyltransferase
MAIASDVHSPEVNFEQRLVCDLDEMRRLVAQLRAAGNRIVLTSGSFDLIHLGHVKYLAKAKSFGDILVVGVDSDEKIRRRKGPGRPMVPEAERLELLAHQRPVDLVYLKGGDDPRWSLVQAVEPDVLVVSEDHGYDDAEAGALARHCGRIEVLERQASVTTSERIRQMYMHLGDQLGPMLATSLTSVLPHLIDDILKRE